MAAIVGTQVQTSPTAVGGGAVPAHIKSRPSFVFAVAPGGWEYSAAEDCWLPILKRLYVTAGAHGTEADRNPAKMFTERRQRGFTVIDPTDDRLGKYRNYVTKIPYAGNGGFFVSIFDGVDLMPGGRVMVERDTPETVAAFGTYNEFRMFLVETGIVPALDPRWRKALLGDYKSTLTRKAGRAALANEGSPAHKALSRYEEMVRCAESAGMPEPPEPVKQKPRRRKVKATAAEGSA